MVAALMAVMATMAIAVFLMATMIDARVWCAERVELFL
jgi:hypothetical protein